jgi:hypothetical protein
MPIGANSRPLRLPSPFVEHAGGAVERAARGMMASLTRWPHTWRGRRRREVHCDQGDFFKFERARNGAFRLNRRAESLYDFSGVLLGAKSGGGNAKEAPKVTVQVGLIAQPSFGSDFGQGNRRIALGHEFRTRRRY